MKIYFEKDYRVGQRSGIRLVILIWLVSIGGLVIADEPFHYWACGFMAGAGSVLAMVLMQARATKQGKK